MDIRNLIKIENIIRVTVKPMEKNDNFVWVNGNDEESRVVIKKGFWPFTKDKEVVEIVKNKVVEGFRYYYNTTTATPIELIHIESNEVIIKETEVFFKPSIRISYTNGTETKQFNKTYDDEKSFDIEVSWLRNILGEKFIYL